MRPEWKPIVWALVIGMLFGAGIVRSLGPRPWWAGHGPGRMVARLSSKLKLTPEQHGRLEQIIESKRQKMDALRAEMRPRFEEIRESTRADIRKLLDPEQQAKFDKIEAEWKQVHDKTHPQGESGSLR